MTKMKRLAIFIPAIVLAMSTAFNVSVSFAEDTYENQYQYDTETTESTEGTENGSDFTDDDSVYDDGESQGYEYGYGEYTEDIPLTKDTDWFDYDSPKKSYKIKTEEQLMGLASLVNEEQIEQWKPTRIENFEGVTFTLTEDIELTEEWTPIGLGDSSHFAGIFDGNGHTISGLDMESKSELSGLFGYLTGEVKDLKVEGKIKAKTDKCGSIAGYLAETGKISNCTSDVKIDGKDKTGGIVGYNEGGTVENCKNIGEVSGTYKVGGIVGENFGGTISQCANLGEVISSFRGVETYGTGGIAGRSVSGTAVVSECYNAGAIVSNTEATGGVVGYVNAGGSLVEDSYNMGTIEITKEDKKDAVDSNAGGVIGTVGMKGVKIQNCYNAGRIKGADVVGGVIGKYFNESEDYSVYIRNNYYLHDYSKDGIGECEDDSSDEISSAATSISGNVLKNAASTVGMEYVEDSSKIYGSSGYPVLRWQEPLSDEERARISNVPQDLQQKLDGYLKSLASSESHGEILINFFNPKNSASDALVVYKEQQGKSLTE